MYSLQALVFERTVMSIAAAVAAGFSLCAPATGQDDAPPDERGIQVVDVGDVRIYPTSPALQKRVPEVHFEELPLEQVIEFITDFGELNIIVRWQVLEDGGVERDKPITIKCWNLRLSQLMWLVLNEASGHDVEVGYEWHDGFVVVSTVADLESEKIVKTYDVRPLLRGAEDWDRQWLKRKAPEAARIRQPSQATEAPDIPDTPSPAARPGTTAEPSAVDQEPAPEQLTHPYVAGPADQLVGLVEQAVRPETWLVHGGEGTAQSFGGVLIVRASRSVHRQLEAFLNALSASVAQGPEQE